MQQQANAAATADVLARLTQQLQALGQQTVQASRPAPPPPKLPKLPDLLESDNEDEWFAQAERIPVTHGVPQEQFSLAVVPALTGIARSAFLSLPAEEASDFGQIKRAVLDRFQLTAEEYRRRPT